MPSARVAFVTLSVLVAAAASSQTVLYEEDFQGDVPSVSVHTSSQKHTIHFNGIADEEGAAGNKVWKLDVSFEDGDYFYVMFPTPKFPLSDDMQMTAKVFLKEGGHAGLGHNLLSPMSRHPEEGVHRGSHGGCTVWKLWSGPTGGWQTLAMGGNELRNHGEETCAGLLTNPKLLGLSADYLPLYFKIEDPLYDAWYINVRFMKGRRVVVYVDDVKLTSRLTAEEITRRAQGAQARFERDRDSLVKTLADDLAAAEDKARVAAAADATQVERLRNALAQSRTTWEGAPANLHEWLARAASVGRFAAGLEEIEIARGERATGRKKTDALVFAVKPILAAEQLPAPTKAPAPALQEDSIEISVCPGEVDFGSLCVYAGKEKLTDVTIRIPDLVASDEPAERRTPAHLKALPEPWKFRIDPDDKGVARGYFKADLDVSDWAEIRTDTEKGWDGQGFEDQRIGYGWYRARLAADAEAAKLAHRTLYFQAVDEDAYVYLDGKLIFEHTERTTGLPPNELWITPFGVPLDDIWSGENDAELVVRVYNRKALGGIWKPAYLIASAAALNDEQMKWMVFARQTRPAFIPSKRIAASSFDPYIVQWWYRINPDDKKGPALFRGELLVKDPQLVTPDHTGKTNKLKFPSKEMRDPASLQAKDLSPGEGVQYFIIARVPSDALPGRYSGTAEVTSGDAAIAEVPIALTVLPFRLADPVLDYSIYYRGGKLGVKPGAFASVGSEYKTDAQLTADVADMLDHGIRHPIWYTSHQRILNARNSFAITGPVFVTYPNAPRADQTSYIQWSANVIGQLRAGGCDPVYIAGPDEPNVDKMAYTREVIDNAHRFLGVKVFTAVCTPLSWENLRQHLDLPIVYIGRTTGREAVAKWHGDGKPVYTYGLASFHADALEFRKYYGLGAWKVGCDGAAPYAYQHAGDDPWDALQWQCNFTWPTADGRISTVQWEGMRAAVSDVRYVSTLAKWLLKTAGPLADHPARVAAERALASINPEGDLDSERAKIIKHVLSLRRAMQETSQ